ncbi:MAG: hypothetical protein Q7U75_16945, partial [Desulfobacterales bacterium]|nr:hypothetical protein [Desulfobacterales bacterium]
RHRVVAVVVALGAADRRTEKRGRHDLQHVGHHLLGVGRRAAARGAVRGGAEETGRGEEVDLRRREVRPRAREEFVAGELFGDFMMARSTPRF